MTTTPMKKLPGGSPTPSSGGIKKLKPLVPKSQETAEISPHRDLMDSLRKIIARDQDWETVTLTSYGTVVKYKK